MVSLNFPLFRVRTKTENNRTLIFDCIRKKYVALTPEEWVRQHLINYLVVEKYYPASLISVEMPFKCSQLDKRSDVLVNNRNGQPLMLIECKAPEIPITQKVFEQITVYNLTIQAACMMVTNGLKHYCMTTASGTSALRFLNEIPDYTELLEMQQK